MTLLEEKKAELAASIMFNNKAECEAIEFYSNLSSLIHVVEEAAKEEGDLDTISEMQKLDNVVDEIISDELNHQQLLFSAYVRLTEIMPAIT